MRATKPCTACHGAGYSYTGPTNCNTAPCPECDGKGEVPDLDAPQVVCAWCEIVMRDGVEPVSHGICDDERCQQLQTSPLYPWRVLWLAHEMTSAMVYWDHEDQATKDHYHRCATRYNNAHRKLVEDYEAEIRRLKIAAAETTNLNGDER